MTNIDYIYRLHCLKNKLYAKFEEFFFVSPFPLRTLPFNAHCKLLFERGRPYLQSVFLADADTSICSECVAVNARWAFLEPFTFYGGNKISVMKLLVFVEWQ